MSISHKQQNITKTIKMLLTTLCMRYIIISQTTNERGEKMRNIRLKTEGLTEEENEEIYDFFRKLRRKRRIKAKKELSYELKMGEKKCVTR